MQEHHEKELDESIFVESTGLNKFTPAPAAAPSKALQELNNGMKLVQQLRDNLPDECAKVCTVFSAFTSKRITDLLVQYSKMSDASYPYVLSFSNKTGEYFISNASGNYALVSSGAVEKMQKCMNCDALSGERVWHDDHEICLTCWLSICAESKA